MSKPIRFATVGELRRALDGVPDERFVACQVIATDGSAWMMWGSFCPQVPQGTIAALTMEHAELKTLPPVGERSIGEGE